MRIRPWPLLVLIATVLALSLAAVAQEPPRQPPDAPATQPAPAPAPLQSAQAQIPEVPESIWLPVAVTLIAVFATGAGIMVYLWFLQRRFLAACQANGELVLYAQNPAGVPAGTVRALLALFIVFATVAFLAISILRLPRQIIFPEIMTGILGTVLGFYFGNRASGGTQVAEAMEQATVARRQRDEAVSAGKASRLDEVQSRVRDGVEVARTVAKVLPAPVGQKVDRVADTVGGGLEAVDRLRQGGRTDEALAEAGKLVNRLRGEDPVRATLLRAADSFAGALGGAAPPLAVAMAVVTVGSRLAGAAYDRWVARVLHAPYTPELFPPSVIDANTGLSLLLQCPIFARAFAAELSAGDRDFARRLVERALSEEGVEELWREYGARFDDRASFDQGVDEFQLAAIRQEVLKDVPDNWAPEVGGAERLLAAVDRLHADEAARRDLDQLVLMADELKRSGRQPEAVFRDARQRTEAQAA